MRTAYRSVDIRATGNGVTIGASDVRSSSNILTLGGTSEVIRIVGSSGNVGIGTTSPTTYTGYTTLALNNATSGGLIDFASNGTIVGQISNTLNSFDISSIGAKPLIFYSNSNERMRITSAGELLINTTSDIGDYKLQVNGNVYSGGQYFSSKVTNLSTISNTPSNASLLLYAPTTTSYYGGIIGWAEGNIATSISAYDDGTGGALGLSIATGNNSAISERMRITSGGNVQIAGSFTPAGTLDVNGSIVTTNGAGTTYNQFVNVGNDVLWENRQNGNIIIRSNSSTERMRINTNGELLINTTSDAGDYKLQVNGNVYATGTIEITNTNPLKFSYGGNADIWMSGNGTLRVINQAYSSSLFSISNAGNVEASGSIKTAAPSGGTAKPYKWGEAGVAIGGSDGYAVKVEIDGTLYYLMTAYLPEPAPEAAPSAGPAQPYSTVFEQPIMKIRTDSQKVKDLEKQIIQLKEMISKLANK